MRQWGVKAKAKLFHVQLLRCMYIVPKHKDMNELTNIHGPS